MTADRWSVIDRLFHETLARPADERAAYLSHACDGDDALRRGVESLIARDGDASFLSMPAATFDHVPAIQIGQTLGPYVVSGRLGEGGMGEVYRARDTKLDRDVAIKVLPAIFTSDPERLARFEREARMLAALNHPHIGAIYGLEESDGIRALILELVDGPTLADRLSRGPLPLAEALPIAMQIAEALEAAHDQGIVHRDLKPANIKITPAGVVKVLDFGLAKAAVGAASGVDVSRTPTISAVGTKAGVILGTAAYMSPGQARGIPVDKRADVWAFGCVLYELLTGRLAFPGATLSDTIAAILQGEPDWEALPEATPSGIRRLLRRCLEKDPARRLRDMGDARLDIEEALVAPVPPKIVAPPGSLNRWSTRSAWVVAAAGIAAAVGALSIPYLHGTGASDAHSIRFMLAAPPSAALPRQYGGGDPALSPDGRRLAFVAQRAGTESLWVQPLEALEAQPLPSTDGALHPFWSPDNRTIAFFAQGTLKTISAVGGPVHTLCDAPGSTSAYGGSWSPDGGTLVFGTLQSGILSVPASGGSATALRKPEAAGGEAPLFPTMLPDGRRFVYLSVPSKVVWLGSLDSKESTRLLTADSQVEYVPPGYLVFMQRGTLMAQRFDAQRGALVGQAIPIVERVMTASQGYSASFSASGNGAMLVYRGDPQMSPSQMTWVDRRGRRLGVVGEPGRLRNPEMSPDGTSVALEVLDSQLRSDVWRLDLERGGGMTRLTSDPGEDIFPVWSRDGRWIMFSSDRHEGVSQLYRMRADGTGGAELVHRSSTPMLPQSWGLDGQPFVYQSRPVFNLGLLPLVGGGSPHLFDPQKTLQGFGQVSPNGRWLAYGSSEPGWDVYVQSFPEGGGKRKISKDGGASPRWSRDGREIFYYANDGWIMAVPVTSNGPELEIRPAVPLFEASLLGGPPPLIPFKQQYDVARDGRFLLNLPVAPVSDQSFSVYVNWTVGLSR